MTEQVTFSHYNQMIVCRVAGCGWSSGYRGDRSRILLCRWHSAHHEGRGLDGHGVVVTPIASSWWQAAAMGEHLLACTTCGWSDHVLTRYADALEAAAQAHTTSATST